MRAPIVLSPPSQLLFFIVSAGTDIVPLAVFGALGCCSMSQHIWGSTMSFYLDRLALINATSPVVNHVILFDVSCLYKDDHFGSQQPFLSGLAC
jgi:hypothetical protein